MFLWTHGIMKKNAIPTFDEALPVIHGTDKTAHLFQAEYISQQCQAPQEITNKGIDGGQLNNYIKVADSWLCHEVVWIVIGKTKPFGTRTESQVNLRGLGSYSRAANQLL